VKARHRHQMALNIPLHRVHGSARAKAYGNRMVECGGHHTKSKTVPCASSRTFAGVGQDSGAALLAAAGGSVQDGPC